LLDNGEVESRSRNIVSYGFAITMKFLYNRFRQAYGYESNIPNKIPIRTYPLDY
jgi:hypothetical protein